METKITPNDRADATDRLADELISAFAGQEGDSEVARESRQRLVSLAPTLEGTKLLDDYIFAVRAMPDGERDQFDRMAGDYRRRLGFVDHPATIEDYMVGLFAIIDRDIRFISA